MVAHTFGVWEVVVGVWLAVRCAVKKGELVLPFVALLACGFARRSKAQRGRKLIFTRPAVLACGSPL